MQAFLVDLDNSPGALAKVAAAIAAKGVNITSIGGTTCGDSGRAALTTSDEAATREALSAAGNTFTEMEIVEVSLRDEPGSLAGACRKLADNAINLEGLLPLGMDAGGVKVGFITADAEATRGALGS